MRVIIILLCALVMTPGLAHARKPKPKAVESTFESTIVIEHEKTAFEKCNEGAVSQDDLEASLQSCNAAAAEAPDNGDVFYYRGFHFFYLDRIEEAEVDFSEAIALNTRYLAESYYQRGACKEQQRRLREASVDFKKANELKPDWGPARRKVEEYHWAYE